MSIRITIPLTHHHERHGHEQEKALHHDCCRIQATYLVANQRPTRQRRNIVRPGRLELLSTKMERGSCVESRIQSALFSDRRPRGRRQLIKTVVRGRFESVAPLLQHSANTAGCFCVIHLHDVTAWRMDAQSEAMLCDIDASRTSLARILICEIDWVHLRRILFLVDSDKLVTKRQKRSIKRASAIGRLCFPNPPDSWLRACHLIGDIRVTKAALSELIDNGLRGIHAPILCANE